MTQKRLLAVYTALLVLFAVTAGRLYLIASNQQYARTAKNQTVTTLELAGQRGNFYDCHGALLTGVSNGYQALSVPGESSYAQLFAYTDPAGQKMLYQRRNSAAPFLIPVTQDLTQQGIRTYKAPQRCLPCPVAPQLLGYLNGAGQGTAGLEAAFDDLLQSGAAPETLRCVTTAQGQLIQCDLLGSESSGPHGLQLTLDRGIQRLCEGTAARNMTSGCILVLESDTAKVRACVSLPVFDPRCPAESIRAGDTSMLNRALCAFNAGSVFKPVLAAAALEQGLGWFTVDCEGWVDLNGHVYRCAKGIAHGKTNLKTALEKSCNCYFIELGLRLGGKTVAQTAQRFGFGQTQEIGGGMNAQAGNLPDKNQLKDLGQLASISFGQGKLMATPLQVAGMMNSIVLDGIYTAPAFLEAVIDEETGRPVQNLYDPQVHRVMRPETARQLQKMLVSVVEEGIGKDARPTTGGAGGKTGTAQTGRLDAAGDEQMNFWFAGFYPAQNPIYTIIVLQDGQTDPTVSSAAIFSQICSGISYLDNC